MNLCASPELALMGRQPFNRWLQIAFPVRQRTQYVYGCYLGTVACRATHVDEKMILAVEMIRVATACTVGVPGKEARLEPGWAYGFDPRCLLLDNSLSQVIYHPWRIPLDQHTPEVQRWLRSHPEWMPTAYAGTTGLTERCDRPLRFTGRIFVADEPTIAGDRQATTKLMPGFWGYRGAQQGEMAMVVDLEST